MSRQEKLKIVIIEPSEIVAEGLKEIIGRNPELEIVNTYANVGYYSGMLASVNVVIINPVVINYNERFDIRSYLCANGENTTLMALTYSGYDENVMKQYDGSINIYDNASRIIQKIFSAVDEARQNPRSDVNELSVRERDILVAVAKGRTNKEIADEFNISIYTVISHRRNISRKLGINSIPGLTVYAIMNKLIDITDFS